jgi:putative transposase
MDAGRPCTARPWLPALEMAVNRQLPAGVRDQSVSLRSDHGCQPTALAFMKACRTLGIQQAFTRDNNPTGHADTARVLRTLTAECLWLQEWTGPCERSRALEVWLTDDHEHDLHSALGYQSPRPFAHPYDLSHGTPFAAA